MDAPLTLRAGEFEVLLAPQRGGAIAALRWRGLDLLRPGPAGGEATHPVDLGCFPMVPVCNRVRDNLLRLDDRRWPVRPNFPPQPLHLHGTGWTHAWHVVEATGSDALLRLDCDEAPWRFRAEQLLVLDAAGFSVTLSVENLAAEPMPFGIGLHPYFPVTPRMTLRFAARRFWLMDGDKLPGEPIAVPPELDHAAPRATPRGFRNHVYEGWDGEAAIAWPEHGVALALRADPLFAHLLVFRPPAQPVVALEPMSHVPGADGLGWRALAPGKRMQGRVALHPRGLIA
jgi:aldose 1-epimerase